ncbi:putative 1-aminocyclopropane-1-carboxylate deaminase [Aspergillus steynii IBT 23096]|uniref:Putative 1-aminocyclopropane-1-carboxylate deaminase n=1 Tax=Aspergillus steynii IBT 23096 TaxID=1392250 RepID=A0A2I2GGA2_9EURO|nr:putative 1-aminocyclopropane-1-carboxylate deaminase [Aspergillus steynii IBT 23096]PLB51902.1 putative 1-aminocyclopropane-1-carboxylate deaminase [Aspergillus steynii IBT 23096]
MCFSLPEAFAKIPRHPFLYSHPSPIHPLPALSTLLTRTHHHPTTNAPSISLFAKREDQCSPLACSGNKYRKLEYIVPHIQRGCAHQPDGTDIPDVTPTTLVTEGAVQSNHTVQVAAVATQLGLDAVVVLHKSTGGGLASTTDAPAFLRTGNVQVDRLLGADVRLLESDNVADDGSDPIAPIMADLWRRGKVPYWIPSGASLHPLGGLGYARCAFEIAEQEEEQLGGEGRRFDYVFVACGSGSTVAGLIAGFKLLEKMEVRRTGASLGTSSRRVIGILNSPTKPREYHEGRVLQFARRAAVQIGLDAEDITADDVRLDDRFAGTGYGVLDPKTKETLALMAQREGVLLDPVYTAKVARGMAHWVQQGDIARDWPSQSRDPHPINALFIHTGGQSALGAYADVE